MADARKKVVVRRFEGAAEWGYLPQSGFVANGWVEGLDVAGRLMRFDLNEIKMIAYVKDFNLDDAVDPERMGRKAFLGRPRGDGLWVKMTFRDGDWMEGLAHFDVGFLEQVIEDRGFSVSLPDARANTQRVFVPRSALAGLEVLGYIGKPAKKKALEQTASMVQAGLFEELS
jgi:hypothetical protein